MILYHLAIKHGEYAYETEVYLGCFDDLKKIELAKIEFEDRAKIINKCSTKWPYFNVRDSNFQFVEWQTELNELMY